MMYIGMLWFDNDNKSGLNNRVERAAEYYQRKYGKTPNMCYVHPSMIAPARDTVEEPTEMDATASLNANGVQVRPLSTVLPNHFWIGVSAES